MSMHKSLRSKNKHLRSRNVLSREERIDRLTEQERWEEEQDSVFSLPKVKVEQVAPRKRAKEEAPAEGLEGAAEGAEGAETPAEESGEES